MVTLTKLAWFNQSSSLVWRLLQSLQNRLRLMAHELRKLGIDIPGEKKKEHHDTSAARELPPNEHHRIARQQHARNRLTLNEWREKYTDDPSSIVSTQSR